MLDKEARRHPLQQCCPHGKPGPHASWIRIQNMVLETSKMKQHGDVAAAFNRVFVGFLRKGKALCDL